MISYLYVWDILTTRIHDDFCERCEYEYSLAIVCNDGAVFNADIYKSCSSFEGHKEQIINMSNKDGDYASGLNWVTPKKVVEYILRSKGRLDLVKEVS